MPFVDSILPYVRSASEQTGIPVGVMMAQIINETGNGTSGWWQNYNNPAGLGVTGAPGVGNRYSSPQAGIFDYANHLLGQGEAGQGQFVADLKAHKSDQQLLADIENSPWAAGHYGGNGLENLYRSDNLGQYDISGIGFTGQMAGDINGPYGAAGSAAITNGPQIQGNNVLMGQLSADQAFANQTYGINRAYANTVAQNQLGLLNLNKQDLWLQAQNAQWTGQQQALANKEQKYQHAANIEQIQSQGAAGGNLFTRGHYQQEAMENLKMQQENEQYWFETLRNNQFLNGTLQLQAKRYGINEQEIRDRLQNQLSNMDIAHDTGAVDFLSQMAQLGIQNAALQMPGTYPPGSTGPLGGYDQNGLGVGALPSGSSTGA